MFNPFLLGKWLWWYVHRREAWWRAMVDSKFGISWGGWCFNEPIGPYGVGLWKNIKRVGASFQIIPNLRWDMAPRLYFGIICGVLTMP
jgi:hypothetical protein